MAEKPRECRARVAAVRRLAPDVLEVDLAMEDPAEFAFAAGQWVSVPFGPKTVRAYSIASAPRARRVITLCADVAPGGLGSKWVAALEPGAEVRFKGPLGGFVFSRTDPRSLLLVAEEIGIVPIRSILLDLYDTGFGRSVRLIQQARDAEDLVYGADFCSLARRYPAFSYDPCVGGQLPAVVEQLVTDVRGLVAYVAGGGETIDAVRKVLVGKGLERKAVKWERFW